MQRRAVAVYAAMFLIVAAASYGLVATAEEPTITLEEADFELSEGETFSIGEQTYTVSSIEETEDEETGERTFAGELEWTVADVEQTEIWNHEGTIEFDDSEWQVLIDQDEEEPAEFTLEELIDRQAILEADPDAANETVESDGEEFVDLDGELVPVDDYFAAPENRTFAEDDTLTYNNQMTTVEEVDTAGVTVSWIADETRTADLNQGELIELDDGNEYLTFFPGDNTVMITLDATSYDEQVTAQQQFADRTDGLQNVTIVSLLIVLSLIAFAFLPSRY